jgi:hypothetical protein
MMKTLLEQMRGEEAAAKVKAEALEKQKKKKARQISKTLLEQMREKEAAAKTKAEAKTKTLKEQQESDAWLKKLQKASLPKVSKEALRRYSRAARYEKRE